MNSPHINRRDWLTHAGVAALSVATSSETLPIPSCRAEGTAEKPLRWRLGCFNRPWMPWTYDTALDAIAEAGFTVTGILGDHAGESFTADVATPDDVDRLAQRIAQRSLQPIVGWLRTRHTIPLAEARAQARTQIDHAARLGLGFMLTVGVDPPEQFEHFYQVMADAAEYAVERQVQIVLKPHGGCSAAADELLRCIDKIDHDNFRLWYDGGNILHYTGKDPVGELERVFQYVTGLCAKDCGGRGQEVMIRFGDGKVDFSGMLHCLAEHRFAGPVLVECCGGKTRDEVTAGARENRLFLEKLISKLPDDG